MSNRFTCTLNGTPPESISDALRVTDLTELTPRTRVVTQPTGRHGLRVLRRVRESLTVRISLVIAEYDPARRRQVLQSLNAWADRGGWLTVSDRPGQRLRVDYCTLPVMSALGWSDEIDLECTACTTPFWQTESEGTVTVTQAGLLTLPGTAEDCPVSAEVTNHGSAPLTTLTLGCGDTQMTFEGLALAPGGILALEGSGGVLRATADGQSVLMRRTGDSADLLLAGCGVQTPVSVSADQPVIVTFHGRGWVL